MQYKVTEVIDGDTLKVSPKWRFNGKSGYTVRIANVNAPELNRYGGKIAKKRLSDLVQNKHIELKNKVNLSYGRLVCDVYLNRRSIASKL